MILEERGNAQKKDNMQQQHAMSKAPKKFEMIFNYKKAISMIRRKSLAKDRQHRIQRIYKDRPIHFNNERETPVLTRKSKLLTKPYGPRLRQSLLNMTRMEMERSR